MAAHESAGDFIYAEPAKNIQNERYLRLLRQAGVAAGEHHAHLIVLHLVRPKQFVYDWNQRPFAVEQSAQFRGERAGGTLAAQNIERPVLGGGHQPGGGIFRHAAEAPHFQRAAEGVLYDVLCQRQVVDSEDTGEHRNHAPRFVPKKMVRGLHLHTQFLNRTHLDRTTDLKDRTVLRKFSGVSQVSGLDDDVAAHHVRGLGKGAVGDDLLFAGDNLTRMLQRMAGVLNVSLGSEVLEPGDPFFHRLLHLLGGVVSLAATKQISEFAHCVSPYSIWVFSSGGS